MKSAARFWKCPSQLPRRGLGPSLRPAAACAARLPGGTGLLAAPAACLPRGNKAAWPWEAPTRGAGEICLQRRNGRRTWKCELLLSSAHCFPLVLNLWHWNSLFTHSYNICNLPWACWTIFIAGCLWLCRKQKIILWKLANWYSSRLP